MKKYEVEINGEVYHVAVRELADDAEMKTTKTAATPEIASSPNPAPQTSLASSGEGLRAPMPGTILKVLVSSGQSVTEGETLIVLEAMKMENEIVAPADGVVGEILVQANDRVQSDQLLLTF